MVAVATVATDLVHGAALPLGQRGKQRGIRREGLFDLTRQIDVSKSSDVTLSPKQQAWQALSYLFGYQLAGVSNGPEELMLTCENIKVMGQEKWTAMGLDVSLIGSTAYAIA